MKAELGYTDHNAPSRYNDPLRLAQTFYANTGPDRAKLNAFIQREVNALDDNHEATWQHGELHENLLKLPWSDVLTTNWDTLLEEAALDVHNPIYSVVQKKEDLAGARTPRIIKLHGTLGGETDLIFTQEDYRMYLQKHAYFVNLARQIFIENELCLLGFSGDDPNFLQWIGWVRDHLENDSRMIYLVGAHQLNSADRAYYNSLNIAPIDLSSLVSTSNEPDTKHQKAITIFIKALHDLKPDPAWEWQSDKVNPMRFYFNGKNRPNGNLEFIQKILPSLQKERESYPDWLICPDDERQQMEDQLERFPQVSWLLSKVAGESREKLLYEIAWRCKLTYKYDILEWLGQDFMKICSLEKTCSLTKEQQLEIALFVLHAAHQNGWSESSHFAQSAHAILEVGGKDFPEYAKELAYHQAIIARDKLDYAALESHIENIADDTALWKLRKFSLLCNLGKWENSLELLSLAFRELIGNCRSEPNSMLLLSQLAWVEWLFKKINNSTGSNWELTLPYNYMETKCAPEHHFKSIINANPPSLPIFSGISNAVGLPPNWRGVHFITWHEDKLVKSNLVRSIRDFLLLFRGSNLLYSPGKYFRIKIAALAENDAAFLLDQCALAIDYWKAAINKNDQNGDTASYACGRLSVLAKATTLFVGRARAEHAKEIFFLACSMGENSSIIAAPDGGGVLSKLVNYSLSSIPPLQQKEVLLAALLFPLSFETNIPPIKNFPNPIIRPYEKREKSRDIDDRVSKIIDSIKPNSPQFAPALLRLLPLLETGFLTPEERKKMACNIWGTHPDYATLPDTGLPPHYLFELPSPNRTKATTAVRRHLFEADESRLFDQDILLSIAQAARINKPQTPSPEQALAYFKKMVFAGSGSYREYRLEIPYWGKKEALDNAVCKALTFAIVPALHAKALTQENFNELLALYEETKEPYYLVAFSRFAAHDRSCADETKKRIRQGLQGRGARIVTCAALALLTWQKAEIARTTSTLTSLLVQMIGVYQGPGFPVLLATVRQMYCNRSLSATDVDLLAESIPDVFNNANYRNIDPESRAADYAADTRAECARLAKAILEQTPNGHAALRRVLDEAAHDPFPEVRFALDTSSTFDLLAAADRLLQARYRPA